MKTIVRQIKQKRLMVLVLLLLVGMTSVFAQKHVSVSGRITDELNEPNQRARVPLLSFRISGM